MAKPSTWTEWAIPQYPQPHSYNEGWAIKTIKVLNLKARNWLNHQCSQCKSKAKQWLMSLNSKCPKHNNGGSFKASGPKTLTVVGHPIISFGYNTIHLTQFTMYTSQTHNTISILISNSLGLSPLKFSDPNTEHCLNPKVIKWLQCLKILKFSFLKLKQNPTFSALNLVEPQKSPLWK